MRSQVCYYLHTSHIRIHILQNYINAHLYSITIHGVIVLLQGMNNVHPGPLYLPYTHYAALQYLV